MVTRAPRILMAVLHTGIESALAQHRCKSGVTPLKTMEFNWCKIGVRGIRIRQPQSLHIIREPHMDHVKHTTETLRNKQKNDVNVHLYSPFLSHLGALDLAPDVLFS